MQFKLIPEPPADLDRVREAQRAVPLVPGDENDCCARLQRRVGFPSRDVSRTWLTFLRGLDLAEETPSGFKRRSTEPTPEHVRSTLLANVMLAESALAALVAAGAGDDGRPLDADDLFRRTREAVPTYERHKRPNEWESVWRDRADDLLGWLALLDLAEPVDDGGASDSPTKYRPTARGVARID